MEVILKTKLEAGMKEYGETINIRKKSWRLNETEPERYYKGRKNTKVGNYRYLCTMLTTDWKMKLK